MAWSEVTLFVHPHLFAKSGSKAGHSIGLCQQKVFLKTEPIQTTLVFSGDIQVTHCQWHRVCARKSWHLFQDIGPHMLLYLWTTWCSQKHSLGQGSVTFNRKGAIIFELPNKIHKTHIPIIQTVAVVVHCLTCCTTEVLQCIFQPAGNDQFQH